jgi:triphosphoribosyl-dephospho-CoA synthase
MQAQFTHTQLTQLFKQACLDEIAVLKPGNVHVYADGHGMVVDDFIKSADAASQVIAQENISVGQRILLAVNATWDKVGCNTNLGIILLAAPVVHTALQCQSTPFQTQLSETLCDLTVDDAVCVYQAIQRANPAGLGKVEEHDVANAPNITLLEAMRAAQTHDLIAKQYVNVYQDIIEFGIPIYQQAFVKWQRSGWATTLVYLAYLSTLKDSHIARKYGDELATRIQLKAKVHYDVLSSMENPKLYFKELLVFDRELKDQKINPGTSADLTVATLLIRSFL